MNERKYYSNTHINIPEFSVDSVVKWLIENGLPDIDFVRFDVGVDSYCVASNCQPDLIHVLEDRNDFGYDVWEQKDGYRIYHGCMGAIVVNIEDAYYFLTTH